MAERSMSPSLSRWWSQRKHSWIQTIFFFECLLRVTLSCVRPLPWRQLQNSLLPLAQKWRGDLPLCLPRSLPAFLRLSPETFLPEGILVPRLTVAWLLMKYRGRVDFPPEPQRQNLRARLRWMTKGSTFPAGANICSLGGCHWERARKSISQIRAFSLT